MIAKAPVNLLRLSLLEFEMKKFYSVVVAATITMTAPTHAGTAIASIVTTGITVVEHGGGCRKDSPAGMCCHAGSQPYHCH